MHEKTSSAANAPLPAPAETAGVSNRSGDLSEQREDSQRPGSSTQQATRAVGGDALPGWNFVKRGTELVVAGPSGWMTVKRGKGPQSERMLAELGEALVKAIGQGGLLATPSQAQGAAGGGTGH